MVIALSHMALPVPLLGSSPMFVKAHACFLPFAFITPLVVTLIYERPIRLFFKTSFRNGRFENKPPLKVKQRLLNEPFVQIIYFEQMEAAINAYKGLVIQYIGDEIEAVFGAPVYRKDHCMLAVNAALVMRHKLDKLNRQFQKKDLPTLSHGIGIHTGQVLAASIGSQNRLSYALVGDTVNLAARLQALSKDYNTDIIVSGQTCARICNAYDFRHLGVADVRGRSQAVEIYAL